jgi:hypothetical protein
MRRAEQLTESIGRARDYTNYLLAATPTSDWFRMPQEAVSHIAWQVGHLAFAQYRLALERVRGKRPGDEALISSAFLEKFGRASAPVSDSQTYPPADKSAASLTGFIARRSRRLARSTIRYLTSRSPRPIRDSPPRAARSPGAPSTKCCAPARSASCGG